MLETIHYPDRCDPLCYRYVANRFNYQRYFTINVIIMRARGRRLLFSLAHCSAAVACIRLIISWSESVLTGLPTRETEIKLPEKK